MRDSVHQQLLGPLLRDVSRSFYLTLRVLPRQIRPQISLAYLLARATDTIADTRAVARPKRIAVLQQLQSLTRAPELGVIAEKQALPAEEKLLQRLGDCLDALDAFDEADCRRIHDLLETIINGQIFDLRKFPGEDEKTIVALAGDDDLHHYTYLVAGCVGEFWTKMCMAHLAALRGWDIKRMCELGIRFGKGLQLVNVLRDIPRDLRSGRCYLPVADPQALLNPLNIQSIRAVHGKWLDCAVAHLQSGWEYTMRIPSSQTRLRLACVWPIWIGLRTIALLRHGNPLDPARRIKVARGEVYRLMAWSALICRSNRALDGKFLKLLRAARAK